MYGKPSTPINRQAKFEAFLDAQERKQRAVWFSCLPSILDEMARAINLAKDALVSDEEKSTNFEQRTAVKLRPMYRELQQIIATPKQGYDEESRSRELIGNMISQVNSWFRSSRVAVGLKQEMDPRYTGKAAIAAKYELAISDDFNVTCNRGWQR